MALSRDQIITTAVDILTRYGLADLSMRRLARELDVQPGALYWHVANKQELLVEVADVLLAQIELAPGSSAPLEALADLARAIRAAVLHVPDGAEVVALAYAVDAEAVRPLRHLATLARLAGVPRSRRQAVAELVVHHVLGSVTTEQNQRQAAAVDGAFEPRTTEASTHAFEVGLAVILGGLAAARLGTDRMAGWV